MADYPHDGSEILGTLGPQRYRCARGNCGQDIGHPANQDQHNADAHIMERAQQTADSILKRWNENGDPFHGGAHGARFTSVVGGHA